MAAGDPLFRPVKDVVRTVLRELRRRLDREDVRTCGGLRDGERDELLSAHDAGNDFGFELLAARVENGRNGHGVDPQLREGHATTAPGELVPEDELVEGLQSEEEKEVGLQKVDDETQR